MDDASTCEGRGVSAAERLEVLVTTVDIHIDPPHRAGTATDPEQVVALLGVHDPGPGVRPEFAPAMRARFTALMNELQPESGIWIGKRRFVDLLHCEAVTETDYKIDEDNAVGEIAHRALAILFGLTAAEWADYTATRLVAAAVRTADGDLAEWIGNTDPEVVLGVRAAAVSKVAGLLDVWPAMPDSWRPVPEHELRVGFGRLTLSGFVDLALFGGRDASGRRPGRVLLEWKTGARWPNHDGEAVWYALAETLKFNRPPRLVGTWYLGTGDVHLLELNEEHLSDAFDKLERAVRVAVELQQGREPVRRGGPRCRFCVLSNDCPEAQA